FKALGIRIEPPMSEPIASVVIPAESAAADPPDEPPGVYSALHGFRVIPHRSLQVTATKKNSGAVVCTCRMAPAVPEWDISPGDGPIKRMARRQQRLDAFVHEGEQPADERVELLCEDHIGTYVVPFLCQWSSGDWKNVETGERIDATVIGWRVQPHA